MKALLEASKEDREQYFNEAAHLGEALRIDPVVIEKCLGHKMPSYNGNLQ